jgi:hypothetical protein
MNEIVLLQGEEYGSRSLEDSVVKMCVEMMSQEWSDTSSASLPGDRGLTLLHLAGALGYTRLILTLIQWKRENPTPVLLSEIDAWKCDEFGLLPLVRLKVIIGIESERKLIVCN